MTNTSYRFRFPWQPIFFLLVFSLTTSCYYMYNKEDEGPKNYVLVVHGGAGFAPEDMPAEKQEAYKAKLLDALAAGEQILKEGGEALLAVETTIRILENDPFFNAGRGAVYTADGDVSLDASIMDGRDHQAGAVSGVSRVKNPISAALKVMTDSKHVMLSGAGADLFAERQGLEIADSGWFFTEETTRAWEAQKAEMEKMGTVGAVARDIRGNLAAGTSTGGMMMKEYGRIGDSPIIGAGTWADNASCAISCTGHGEYFIRWGAAHEVSARMEHRKWTLERASDYVINDLFRKKKANGGMIGVDVYGNIVMPFNTPSMFRAYVKQGEEPRALIFKE